jgi:D-sedoheptulose 7-phosphate isomerase
MNNTELLRKALADHQDVMTQLTSLLPDIDKVGQMMRACLQRGNKILLMGNGGSAADSQHIAAEIVGRYKRERRGLPAIALTTDTSILTAVGNDYGFDQVFSRQVEALCDAQDVVVGISTSGNSANVVKVRLQPGHAGEGNRAHPGSASVRRAQPVRNHGRGVVACRNACST